MHLRDYWGYAELQGRTDHEKLLQFVLHLTGKAESMYEVLPASQKDTFVRALGALGA